MFSDIEFYQVKIEQVCQTVLFLADAKNTSECFQTFKNTKSFLVDRTGAVRRRISEEEDASGLNAPLFSQILNSTK